MADHYFTEHPQSADGVTEIEVTIFGSPYRVKTQHGIFSPRGIDKGTAVFLHKVPLPSLETGSLALDLGCGWGPLTLALADSYPDCDVLAVDINDRAIALTSQNAARHGYKNVRADDADAIYHELVENGCTIDLLWSNPPIRIGKTALHELLTTWLDLLSNNGVAYLVVQKNLGSDSLMKWLNEQHYDAKKIGSSQGFRIIEVHPHAL